MVSSRSGVGHTTEDIIEEGHGSQIQMNKNIYANDIMGKMVCTCSSIHNKWRVLHYCSKMLSIYFYLGHLYQQKFKKKIRKKQKTTKRV